MKLLGLGRIYTDGKITIPKLVRQFLKVKDGDSVFFELKNNSITLSKNELEDGEKTERFKIFSDKEN